MNIYVKFEIPKTIKEFLILFFSNQNRDQLGAVETYLDKEYFHIQCYANKWRSFDDLLDIVNTYYHKVSPRLLMKLILTTELTHPLLNTYLRLENCSGMKRVRIIYYYQAQSKDPFDIGKFESKWSWKELLNMLGINNKKELELYVLNHKVKEVKMLEVA